MKKALIAVIIVLVGLVAYFIGRDRGSVSYVSPLDSGATSTPSDTPLPSAGPILEGAEDKVITEESQYIKVNVHYPAFKNKAVSDAVKAAVNQEIATFKAETNIEGLSQSDKDFQFQNGSKYEITITYTIHPAEKVSTVILSIATYTGGAHGSLVVRSLNFNAAGSAIVIGDLFKPESDYLTKLSVLSRVKLKATLGNALGAWSDDGTAAASDNFSAFYLSDDNMLHVIFQPYQVAPWVAGSPEVSIDLIGELGDVISPVYIHE